ncbi:unnamed protein product [Brachionus calyciflorus]|uniref:Ferric-chelate reductase 1 n=1 Tax=Brachionus calyciflorus TaxID=104777 RepID=A0A814AA65_9BILA|nr:unnamed protein product [Brachionus calyciflorus]
MNLIFYSIFPLILNLKVQTQNIETSECEKSYGCFKVPENCENKDCEYLVKWKENGDSTDFVIGTIVQPSNFYLAVGFSDDKKMGNDSVVMCFNKRIGRNDIQHFFNSDSYSSVLKKDDPDIGLSEKKILQEDNFLSCSFRRKKFAESENKYFDLRKKAFLIMAKGNAFFENSDCYPENHKKNRLVSSEEIDFSRINSVKMSNGSYTLRKIHSSIMLFAWMFLSTLGIILERYYKYLGPDKKYFGVRLWFLLNDSSILSVNLLTILGLAFILIDKKFSWTSISMKANFSHSILGIIAICISVLQFIFVVLKPKKDQSNQKIFYWIQNVVRILANSLSIFSIMLGMIIFFKNNNWSILVVWLVWLFFMVLVLELIDNKKESNSSKILPSEISISEDVVKPSFFFSQDFKKILLIVHFALTSALFLTIIILISLKKSV